MVFYLVTDLEQQGQAVSAEPYEMEAPGNLLPAL